MHILADVVEVGANPVGQLVGAVEPLGAGPLVYLLALLLDDLLDVGHQDLQLLAFVLLVGQRAQVLQLLLLVHLVLLGLLRTQQRRRAQVQPRETHRLRGLLR